MFKRAVLATTFAGLFLSSSVFASTTLNIWCWDDNFNAKAAHEASLLFKKSHPDIDFNIVSLTQVEIVQKLNAALAADNHSALPDIVLIDDYRVQNFLHDYPNFLMDLTGRFDPSVYTPFKLEFSSRDGKYYGLPFDVGVATTFVRIDLFEKAGFSLDDLEDMTWQQFIEMGKKVKEVTGHYLLGLDVSNLGVLRLILQSGNVWYVDSDNRLYIKDNVALKEALSIFKELSDNQLLTTYYGWNAFLEAIEQNKVAAVVQGCWMTPSIEKNKEQYGKWRIVPLPRLSTVEGATAYSNLGGSQWYVNNYSDRKELAAHFLISTLGSDKELLDKLITEINLVSSRTDLQDLSSFKIENDFLADR